MNNQETYTAYFVRSTFIVFLFSILAGILGYILRLILARNMTQEEFGLFYSILSFVGFFILFKDLGLGQSLSKFIPEFIAKKRMDNVKGAIILTFLIQFISSGIISIIIIIFSGNISGHYFRHLGASIPLILIVLSYWISTFMDVFSFSSRGFQKMFYFSINELLRVIIIIISVFIGFFIIKDKVIVASASYLIASVILSLILIRIFFNKIFPDFFKVKSNIKFSFFKKLLYFGINILTTNIGATVLIYTDVIMLTYFTNLKQVALYNVAIPTTMLLWYISHSISNVLMPLVSELSSKRENNKIKEGISLVYKYSLLLAIPLALAMFSFPDEIINVLFGNKYADAKLSLQILSIGAIFYTIAFINSNIIIGLGKPKINTKIIFIAAIFNVILNLILIPRLGSNGASISTSLSYFLILVMTIIAINKNIELKATSIIFIKLIILSIIFVTFIFLTKNILKLNYLIEIIISLIISSFIYLMLSYKLRMISIKQIKEIFGLLKSH